MAKPRKWSNLEGSLPAPPEEDSEYVKKLLARKDELRDLCAMTPNSLANVAKMFKELDVKQEVLTARQSDLNLDYAALESLTRDLLKASETDLWRGEGMTLSPANALHASTTDRHALLEWIRATNREDLLAVMPGTVKSLASAALDFEEAKGMTPAQRAELKPGEPGSSVPPPGVTVYLRPTINRRKA